MLLKPLLSGLLILLPTLAAAAPVTYTCYLKPQKNEELVPDQAVYRIDLARKTATAFDPVIQYAHKAPVAAEFAAKGDGTYELTWNVTGLPAVKSRTLPYHPELSTSTNIKFSVRYTATLNPQSGQVKLRGFSMTFGTIRGTGTCKTK